MIKLLIVGPPSVAANKLYSTVPSETAIKVLGVMDDEANIKNTLMRNEADLVLIHQAEENLFLAERMKQYSPKVKLLFVLASPDRDAVLYGLKIGVVSFILDNVTPHCLVRSIKNVNEDLHVVSGELVRNFFSEVPTDDFFEKQLFKHKLMRHYSLSSREKEVAFLVYKNKKNVEIAERLQLKEKTVRDYVSKMYRKFEVRKRKELIQILNEIMSRYEIDKK
ncbi:helix-turn-helix transcriptional regulator [Oceanobacillus manasiensis]|uniref:helix-turn-helix transcriptional regulator n=1 Tax=Oceanobacillus manasiensis TaxID=586413 RepID=UPI0005AA69AB|nr:LuxR C-terminal-related transcriptional regulator [Oceanobacillus manasiensis]